MRTPFALCVLALLLGFSGCIEDPQAQANTKNLGGKQAPAAPKLVSFSKLTAVAEKVLVSPAGHRMAEFMVARNPLDDNHLILAAHDYDNLGTGTMNCVLYVSRDGGASWKQSSPIPGLTRPHLQFDGWVSFDLNGVAHFVCLDYSNGPSSVPFYTYSTDGGSTWARAVVVGPMAGGCDKSALHAGSDGRVYIACSQYMARTDDMGKTWLPRVNIDGSNANGLVEDQSGNLYLITRGGVSKSTDRGDTWKRTQVGPFQVAPGYNDQNRWVRQEPWTTLPTLTRSPVTDHLFVGQQSWNSSRSAFDSRVYISTDQGVTWTAVSPLPFKPACPAPCSITKPSVTVDDEGRLGVLVQLVNEGGHYKEVHFTASPDEGQTWAEPFVLSKTAPPNGWLNPKAFTPSIQGAAGLATYLASNPTDAGQVAIGLALTTAVQELQMRWNGEYWGIHSSPHGFVVPWIDHSNDGVPQVYSRLVKAE